MLGQLIYNGEVCTRKGGDDDDFGEGNGHVEIYV